MSRGLVRPQHGVASLKCCRRSHSYPNPLIYILANKIRIVKEQSKKIDRGRDKLEKLRAKNYIYQCF